LNLNYLDSLETHVESENNENSTACEKENIAQNRQEHTDDHDTEKLDEDLISAVKERPPLYDFRIPVKERGRKQKDCLWQEVSECLKGLYTATEAEKRWTYLKNCFRNIYKKKQNIVQKSGAAALPKNYEIKPSFRHYDVMSFLNDTLEYRQTVTSLQKSMYEEHQASCSKSNSIPSTSTSDNLNVDDDDLIPIINDNPTSLSSVSPASSKSRKRKRIDLEDYEEAFITNLTQKTESNPIHGFVSRLAEGLHRLTYKSRCKLEIEFLTRLCQVEEDEKYKKT
ncbi:uncharacterized protein, partial [Temnothorax nylanderi]|uniref:uncharacterized protein n=1 Tax=Temnothorax nylanderi TaxID=102681 RepID=UPI003A836BC4